MGQHSQKSAMSSFMAPGKRRWTTVVAGVAVVAAASTAAWAAVANGDTPTNAAGLATASPPLAASPTPATSAPSDDASAPSPKSPSTGSKTSSSPSPTSATASTDSSSSSASKDSSTTRSTGKVSSSKSSDKDSSSTDGTDNVQSPPKKLVNKPKAAAPPKARVLSSGTCGASYYGEPQMTASGERFNPSAMTAAHKTLPLGSKVRVINPKTGESVTVRINDRGPFVSGRCLDLSQAAFSTIGNTSAGVMTVKYQVLAR